MEKDWRDDRFHRLSERVDRIERERRDEKQRQLDRWLRAMLAVVWLMSIATVVLAIVKHVD
jgi:hypothetical protein